MFLDKKAQIASKNSSVSNLMASESGGTMPLVAIDTLAAMFVPKKTDENRSQSTKPAAASNIATAAGEVPTNETELPSGALLHRNKPNKK